MKSSLTSKELLLHLDYLHVIFMSIRKKETALSLLSEELWSTLFVSADYFEQKLHQFAVDLKSCVLSR